MSRWRWAWIALVGGGVLWEGFLAPNAVGWGFMAVGLALAWLIERRPPIRTPLDGALLLLLAALATSTLVTPWPELALAPVLRLGAGLVGLYALVYWARQREQLIALAALLVAAGVGLALLSPVVVDWLRARAVLIPDSFYRRFPLLVSDPVHPNIMAALMALLSPLPLAWLLLAPPAAPDRAGWGRRIALGGSWLLMTAVLLATRSRGGAIAGTVGVVLVVWLAGHRRWAALLAILAIAAGALLLLAPGGPAPEVVEAATDPTTWEFRLRVWRTALDVLRDFPFTGVGMAAFNDAATALYAFPETDNPSAHNLYLQVGVDLGGAGLVAILAVLILCQRAGLAARRAFRRNSMAELEALSVGAWAGLTALMAHGLVDVTVWNTRAVALPWLVIGLIVALHEVAARSSPPGAAEPLGISGGGSS